MCYFWSSAASLKGLVDGLDVNVWTCRGDEVIATDSEDIKESVKRITGELRRGLMSY